MTNFKIDDWVVKKKGSQSAINRVQIYFIEGNQIKVKDVHGNENDTLVKVVNYKKVAAPKRELARIYKLSGGGYVSPAYDLKIKGLYNFKFEGKTYELKGSRFEREGDNTDSLVIQDELRSELGSITVKNSAIKRLIKGSTIMGTSKLGKGKLTRIGDNPKNYSGGGKIADNLSKAMETPTHTIYIDEEGDEVLAVSKKNDSILTGYGAEEIINESVTDSTYTWLSEAMKYNVKEMKKEIPTPHGGEVIDVFKLKDENGKGFEYKLIKEGDTYEVRSTSKDTESLLFDSKSLDKAEKHFTELKNSSNEESVILENGGGIGKDFDYEKFDDWWLNKGGFRKTEKIYGKQASENADKIDPKKEIDNIYSDELEKLGRENNLHLKDSSNYGKGGVINNKGYFTGALSFLNW